MYGAFSRYNRPRWRVRRGTHEARALWAKQREVSPMKQGVPQASLRAQWYDHAELRNAGSAAGWGVVLRIGLSNPKCGKRNSFPHFGRRWPGLSTLSGSAGISLRFAQKALLERAGKLELFLQPAEGNRDHALLDALHHTCAGINAGFDMASLPCYRSN